MQIPFIEHDQMDFCNIIIEKEIREASGIILE